MTEQEKERVPGLVRGYLDPTPSLPFVLKRRKEDGSVEDWPFRCRLLTISETMDVLAAAQQYAADRKEAKNYGDIYREAQAVEAIQRATCRPEPTERDGRTVYGKYFVNGDQVRASLTEDECAFIINCIALTKAHYRVDRGVTEADVEKLINALADEMVGPYFLSQWDSADYPQLIYALARSVQFLRTELGLTPSDLLSSSDVDPSTSESGTTGFSRLPDGQLTDAAGGKTDLPTDRMLTREEAREIVRKSQKADDGET